MAMPGQLMFARRLGPTARLLIWLLAGVSLVVIDIRYQALDGLRSGFSLLLQPVRETLRAPADVAAELSGFFTRHRLLQKERDALLADSTPARISMRRTDGCSLRSAASSSANCSTPTVAMCCNQRCATAPACIVQELAQS